jgi:hypothetical protein
MKKTKYFLFFALLFLPFLIFAEEALIESGNDLLQIIYNITSWFWKFFAIATVFAFLYAAFTYITAAGRPGKYETANKMILYGIIGVVIAILSGSFVSIINSFLTT